VDYIKLIKSLQSKVGSYKDIDDTEPFNIILAASEFYYRENYHSDVLFYILKNRKHTLNQFIKYINTLPDSQVIDENNYLDFEIEREEHRIDLLIKSTNHCIIIENKINNAGDMPRQLPNYYNKQKKEGLIVDKIIYLSLDGEKRPDTSTWDDKDLELNNIITYVAVSNGSNDALVNSFLKICMNNTNDEQEKSFYNQYINLLDYLGRKDKMDRQQREKFYNEMLNAEQYKSILHIDKLLNNLTTYRRDRIYSKFKNNHAPFEKTYKYSEDVTGYEYIRNIAQKEHIKIDIIINPEEEEYTKIHFWIQGTKSKSDLIKTILKKIGKEQEFKKDETNSYYKLFKFPEEDDIMYKYLDNIFKLLDKHKKLIK
jgi:hypothetical protein